jgi:hypothetical protein
MVITSLRIADGRPKASRLETGSLIEGGMAVSVIISVVSLTNPKPREKDQRDRYEITQNFRRETGPSPIDRVVYPCIDKHGFL